MSAVRRIFVVGLGLMFVLVVFVPVDSSAEDFKVVWTIQLPRETYFIGETVSFTVTAFASTDPTLKIPGEMALITIRNQSMVEVFSSWITTNSNGSSPIQYDIELTSDTGNYTVILDPLNGETAHESFNVLYNEETYWKERVDQLQEDQAKLYEYINYLFSFNRYLDNRVRWMRQQFVLLWAMSFLTVLAGVYVAMHEYAMSGKTSSGIMSYPGKLVDFIIRRKPSVELDHEIIADATVPTAKRVPIYEHDFFCPICDPNKHKPLTERMARDHLWAVHDRLHLKRDSIMAKLRARKARSAKKTKEKMNEPPAPSFGTVEEYTEGELRTEKIQKLRAQLKFLKKQKRKKLITDAQFEKRLSEIKREKESLEPKKTKGSPDIPRGPTSPMAELTRKSREEQLISTPTKVPSGNVRFRKTKLELSVPITQPEKIITKNSPTAIDELYDRLNNEKVN